MGSSRSVCTNGGTGLSQPPGWFILSNRSKTEHVGLEVWELLRVPAFPVKLEAGLLVENEDGETVLQVFRERRRYETVL